MRISFLLSHPIQYFSPLLRQMAKSDCIELTVYYCSNPAKAQQMDKGFGQLITWDVPLLDGYRSEFLENLSPSKSLDNKFWSLINFGIVRKLLNDGSDVVIVHGWSYFTNCLAIVIAALSGKQVWLRSENPFNQEIKKPKVLRLIKKIILNYGLFKFVSRFLYIGSQNREFYRYYGVKSEQMIYAPYAVDNSFFSAQSLSLKYAREIFRADYNLSRDTVIILYSGKYIQKKRPLDLIRAYAKLNNKPIALVMVGEGELRLEMENLIKQSELKNVFLTGFVNQMEISKYYAASDIFVLPSGPGETWGLVVNEAMLFGLPVIVSSTSGCSADLVSHGENGFVFDEGDVQELAGYLALLTSDSRLREKAGERSRRIIQEFDYSVMIRNIEEVIH